MRDQEQREELRRFLKARRARVAPEDVGIVPTRRRRVSGLRREEVASLAGIGVSWYTALENGEAERVSEATLLAVADALRLSESERDYLLTLAGESGEIAEIAPPSQLVIDTMQSIAFPAYIITSNWDVVDCNDAFCRIWSVDRSELPFNAIERLFVVPSVRAMHGTRFEENMRPVIAMLRSSQGRQPHSEALRDLRDRLIADDAIRLLWDEYEIASPLLSNRCTIESPAGTFTYETVTLPISGKSYAIVVQVPMNTSKVN